MTFGNHTGYHQMPSCCTPSGNAEYGMCEEVEQAAVRTLMAEFARLQAILGEDLTRSLSALHSKLEASKVSR